MNNINGKKKLIIAISIIILLIGIIIIARLGFNFDLRYQETKRIELDLGQEFENQDIKVIANEVLEKKSVVIQKVNETEDKVSIIAKEITDEQKNNIITKINEKYGKEISADSIEIEKVPHTRGRDLIKPYIMPLVISTVIILIYMMVRYYKIGILKVLLCTIIGVDYTEAMLFSIIAITRIPVGRLTMPMIIVIYLLTLMILTNVFEKKLSIVKEINDNKE